jgi:hypothetical protein
VPIASQGWAPRRSALVRAALPATVLCASVAAGIAAGVALAGPAAAMQDPRRPAVEVTAGPSCGPAVVRVQVTGGSAAGHVALVFDGTAVQQEADLAPGQAVELGSAGIDWGVTVDVSVTATGARGEFLEPAQLGTYTRPSRQDCEAISAPPSDVVPSSDVVPAADVPTAAPAPSTPAPSTPAPVPPTPASASRGTATSGGTVRGGAAGTVAAGSEPTRPVALMAGTALLVAAGGLGASALRRPKDDGQPVDLGG